MPEIDSAAVIAAHANNGYGWCSACERYTDEDGRCEPYRLAEALAAEQAKVARIDDWMHAWFWSLSEPVGRSLDAALTDQPEQDSYARSADA